MMFLLDSNLVSEMRSAKRCHPAVRVWQKNHPLGNCWISVITLLEIRQGIERVRRKDSPFAEILDEWLDAKVKPAFDGRVLLVTPGVAESAGRIAAARTRSLADCLIAATALDHGLALATRNVADFEDIPNLKVVNPWEE